MVVRWFGGCANPQPETRTSSPENEGLVPKAPIPKCRIIHKGQANIMQIACAVAGSVPRFLIGYDPKKYIMLLSRLQLMKKICRLVQF